MTSIGSNRVSLMERRASPPGWTDETPVPPSYAFTGKLRIIRVAEQDAQTDGLKMAGFARGSSKSGQI
jgi:hypothetical protein